MYYFSTPDYQGCLQYAELEEEISNYHINNIMNGLAPSMLINFNNGTPSEQAQREIEASVARKFSGSSNAGSFILAFNDNKESSADITPVQLSDAASQYEFLSSESQKKIMVSHRIVSPRLLGVNDSSGFGNNADELETASILMQNTVIVPFQEMLIDAFDKILAFNGISLKLYFKTLQPLQFIDLENVQSEETREEETGQKLSKALLSVEEFGEDEDGTKFIVRYSYAPNSASDDSRDFCKKMVSSNKVYRKEDIDMMSKKSVNAGWGLKGADNYDIWKYKGGGDCHHFWMRKTYMAKKEGFKPVVNDKDVAKRPTDMPNNGFVNK